MHLAKRRIADHFRKRNRQVPNEVLPVSDDSGRDSLEQIPDPAGSAIDAVWEEEWRNNLLTAALDVAKEQVNPKQFQIFHCRGVKGWPVAQVVKALDIKGGQIYLAKHRVGGVLNREQQRLEKELEQGVPQK